MDNLERALKGICIDGGHGVVDGGAVGNGIVEKDLTLEISKYMYDRFKSMGVPVSLTRDSDTTLSSDNRPGVILNKYGNSSDILVLSNHINAGGGEGAEVIYALRNKDTLASKILNNLASEGQIARKYYQKRLPSNPSKDYYYIMRDTPNTESLIIEYGFIDNENDAKKLKTNLQNYAEAVIKAVMDYKGLKYVPIITADNYIVKSGDTLWTIARKNGLTVDELKKLNNLTSNTLQIGKVLKLKDNSSNNSGESNYYTVKSGDSLWKIANTFNTTVNKLKEINNLKTDVLQIGQKLLLPSSNEEKVYTVKSGDTLYAIALKNNTTVDKLKEINNLSSNILSIGQKLLLP